MNNGVCAASGARRVALPSGFTLVELAIYTVVLLLLSAPIVVVVLASMRFTSELDATAKIQERNRTALYWLEREFREAITNSVTVDSAAKTLRFTVAIDHDGSVVTPGDTIEYSVALAPAESANGIDDDGNGLVDEAVLLRRNVSTGQSVIVCAGIDPARSGFRLAGGGVSVDLVNMGSIRNGSASIDVSSAVTVVSYN